MKKLSLERIIHNLAGLAITGIVWVTIEPLLWGDDATQPQDAQGAGLILLLGGSLLTFAYVNRGVRINQLESRIAGLETSIKELEDENVNLDRNLAARQRNESDRL